MALTSPVLADGAVAAGRAALHGTGTIGTATIGTATIGMGKTGTATITITSPITTITSIIASSEWVWAGGLAITVATGMEDARGCEMKPLSPAIRIGGTAITPV